ncbi:hypothetical protein SAMN05421736_12038 [Evansella caseinilytica]|uniref:Uncharacterized protein n=1 Tax=Evansella caseinilytica TaxID=1503961 RepID=A0A1H3UDF6_9BACI|nr:hypothetical protein [Evansella caseinilytica]SDZ60071.1 hypothetical protein SAMN05421736_12038 [Evansella caseinilytica]
MDCHILSLYLFAIIAGAMTGFNIARGDILFAILTGVCTALFVIIPTVLVRIKKEHNNV